METKLNIRPINFKFSDYLSKGYEFYKKDFGGNILAVLFVFLMSIIPFCGLLAIGNFYKYCRKKSKGQQAEASEIFNFDDFVPYLILQVILIAFIFAMYIPFIFMIPFMKDNQEPSPVFGLLFGGWVFVVLIGLFYLVVKAFYIPALISLKGIKDWKTAWNMSKVMTQGNFWNILLFVIVASFLGQIGIIACGIGVLLTIPYYYISTYFAYEDAMQQIDYDEITEIGQK